MRNILVLLGLLINSVVFSQELNCTVNVIAQQTGNDNNVVFKNLGGVMETKGIMSSRVCKSEGPVHRHNLIFFLCD